MWDFIDRIKTSSSYTTLVRAMDAIPSPSNIVSKLMDLTHENRVLKDGLVEGTASTASYALGLPQLVKTFYQEHISGKKSEIPPEQQKYSSEWFKERLMRGYAQDQLILGKTRPELRPGTNDGYIHLAGKVAPLIGTAFIPGGQVLGTSKIMNATLSLAPRVGAIGFAAETGIEGYNAGEEYFGFGQTMYDKVGFGIKAETGEATVAAAPQVPKSDESPQQIKPGQIKQASLEISSPKQDKPTPLPHQTAKILELVLGNDLKNPEDPTHFSQEGATTLQESLAQNHLYTQKIDGIAGKHTLKATDKAIKDAIKPTALTDDLRTQYESRMKDLAKELKETPANAYNYDPRVMALQTCGYALGLYNKDIDGLMGSSTLNAIHLIENKSLSETKIISAQKAPESPQQVLTMT